MPHRKKGANFMLKNEVFGRSGVSVKPTGADRAKNGAESILLRAKLVFTYSTEHSMAAAAVHPVPDSLPVLFAEYGADTYTDQVRFPSRFQSC